MTSAAVHSIKTTRIIRAIQHGFDEEGFASSMEPLKMSLGKILGALGVRRALEYQRSVVHCASFDGVPSGSRGEEQQQVSHKLN